MRKQKKQREIRCFLLYSLISNGFYADKVGISTLAVRRAARNDDDVALLRQAAFQGALLCEIEEDIHRVNFFR